MLAVVLAALTGCYEPPDFESGSGNASGPPPQFFEDTDGPSESCRVECGDDLGCDPGQSCLLTEQSGMICLPTGCVECFDQGASCSSDEFTCEFFECGPPDPDWSETCEEPCATHTDCGLEEACLSTADGLRCLSISCQSCFDAGQFCYYDTVTCVFSNCG
jgi:hypothetical protein